MQGRLPAVVPLTRGASGRPQKPPIFPSSTFLSHCRLSRIADVVRTQERQIGGRVWRWNRACARHKINILNWLLRRVAELAYSTSGGSQPSITCQPPKFDQEKRLDKPRRLRHATSRIRLRESDRATTREPVMKDFLAAAAMAISLAPSAALAQERAGDAALGGLSGAIVLGPVGAVAGLIVGYTAGPAISRSWGLKRTDSRNAARSAQRPAAARANSAASKEAAAETASAAPGRPASGPRTTWDSPPVQGFE